MKVIIEGNAKEIATFVLELQKRLLNQPMSTSKDNLKAISGILAESLRQQ